MTKYVAMFLTGLVGIAAGIQPSVNSAFSNFVSAKGSALFSFSVGMVILFLLNAASGTLSDLRGVMAAPWYLWSGGLLGVFIVYTLIEVLPKIGAGAMLSLLVAFQLITGMVIDHFGWLGTEVIPIDGIRITGVILLLIGVKLIIR